MPETATASSDKFVFPTNCTPLWRAIAKHFASRFAGEACLRRNSEPAVVTTPFMSIKSFTASRNLLLPGAGGHCSMNARSRVALVGRAFGMAQPPSQPTRKRPARIAREAAFASTANSKILLSCLDMIERTKQRTANRANEKALNGSSVLVGEADRFGSQNRNLFNYRE